jgi:uncharacterized protein with beta-barrel porin domain
MSKEKSRSYRRLGLLASSSLAALLSAGGMSAAWAASCTNPVTGAFDNPNGQAVANICVQNTSFTGSITNEGTVSPAGITFKNGTINGGIISSGVIAGGISLDSSSRINTSGAAIFLVGPTFTGGISNAGTISAGIFGIALGVSTFSGGISNSGVISAPNAIALNAVSTFSGNIYNSGTISGGDFAIGLGPVGTFSGNIYNKGTISATNDGIIVAPVSSFIGGITNAGTISAGGPGIAAFNGSIFSGPVSNSGTISAGETGIFIASFSTFSGGIASSGTISAPVGIGVGFVSTFSGGVTNSGTISAALFGIDVFGGGTFSGGISNSGTIVAGATGIVVSDIGSFSGGISNAGTISGGRLGISLNGVSIFAGGVSNSGTISAGLFSGISVFGVSTFLGGISNSGTIIAGATGIVVDNIGSFSGGISNSGTISAGRDGIFVSNVMQFGSSSANGGITNSGTISARSGIGIIIQNVSTFSGGISNSGTIIAGATGIVVDNIGSFSGGISNSGTISAGENGISVNGIGTFSGGISNSGTISAAQGGILAFDGSIFSGGISNAGTILAGNTGIFVASFSTFSGGITNSGIIAAPVGIGVGFVSTFSGGVTNSGTISVGLFGIDVFGGGTFSGGIGNSGMIVAGATGIIVNNIGSFSGGISNAGTISGGNFGINVGGVSTFSGGISNSGTISAANGISVALVSTFSGGISNSGMIVAAGFSGIAVQAVSTFSGGISNSGTILAGSAGVFVSNVSTFSGGISNSGTISAANGIVIESGVTFAPGSAIVNSGTIIGSIAAIDVSQATSPVTIDQTGGLIAGAINLSSNADVLNVSGGTINGNIVGQGTSDTINFALGAGHTFTYGSGFGFTGINQVNVASGLVILDGINSATNVTINGGTLEIGDVANTSATLTSTNAVDVAAGGTLAGHGTILGSVVVQNGGTLMPGGSVGTLTINGNLALSSGSTYVVEIASQQASKTQVNGSATLGGASVVAMLATPQLGFHSSQTFTILTATNALGSGNVFNSVVTLPSVPVTSAEKLVIGGPATLSYDANDVFLSLPTFTVTLALPSNAPLNAQNVTNAINTFINAGGAVPSGFQNLGNLTGNALNTAANQLAGQGQGSFAPTGFQAGSMFLNLMLNPYVEGRGAFGIGGPAVGPALAYAPDQSSAPAANAFSALALGPRGAFEPRMSFWAAAYGGGGTIQGNGSNGAATTTAQIYGFATGIDYQVLPNTIFGLALGGGGTNWGVAQGMGGGRSDMFQAGLYGTSRIGAAYVSGALAYSLQDVTTTRTVTLAGSDTLQGNFAADVASARLEAGYRLPYGMFAMTPYGAVQTQAMFLPSYAEYATSGSSQFALTYTNHTYTATRTELGAWFDSDVLADKGVKLYGRLAWAHDFDNEGNSTAFFQSLPGANFLINSAKPAPNGALVTAGFEYKLADGWSVLGKFDGEFSSTTAIFSGTGAIRKVW